MIRCLFEANLTRAEYKPLSAGNVAIYSHRSPDKETCNEDAAAVFDLGSARCVMVVADGLGGHSKGEIASKLAIEHFEKTLTHLLEETDGEFDTDQLRAAILSAIESANNAICELAVGAATTLAAADFFQGMVRSYHVGDSEIWLVGQRGKMKLQTLSHSPVAYALEAGLLDPADAMSHEDRHLITNVVGSKEMRIDMRPAIPMAPRDTLLLATDGLMDNLHHHEVIEFVRKGPLEKVVNRLANEALDRMHQHEGDHLSKPDDLTMIAFRQS